MDHHFPSGTNPYQSCGYDRIPLIPSEGECVSIRCISPKDCAEVLLHLDVNGNRIALRGQSDEATAPGCILFSVGPFEAGTNVEYAFSFAEQVKYGYSVRGRTALKSCDFLCQTPKEIRACCLLENGERVTLSMIPDGEGFLLKGNQKSCSAEGETAEQACLKTPTGYRICVRRKPFSFSAESPEGKQLLDFQSEKHAVTFTIEKREIKSFSLCLDAVGEGFYGCGEKFDRVNQKDLSPRNIVYEHYTRQGKHTYLPMPWLFTEQGWGFLSSSEYETGFDLTCSSNGKTRIGFCCEVGADGFSPCYLTFGPPRSQLHELHRLTGGCETPPAWAFGPWMSANGWATQVEAMEQVKRMKELDIPATVMVLEAWSDEATFYIWNGAKYVPQADKSFSYQDFSFDSDGPWPDPKAFSEELKKVGLYLILWQIPVLKSSAENNNRQLALDEQEAISKGYCVKNKDGTPYRIPDRWFANSLLLDFTNPEASAWWMEKRRYLRDELGIEGFKTDGGEFVYDPEARFHNGKTGSEMRNAYPVAYTQAYYQFTQAGKTPGVLFSRAGYTGSQSRPMHWAGDQISTFAELKGQLTAGLSAGLSGIPFWGFDIAGFAGELPTTELYLRAAAMAAFCPVMQFHSEPRSGQFGDSRRRDWINDRSPWNMARVNEAPEIVDIYRRYAKLRMRLLPYILREAAYCAESARPLLCHLIYEYPDDPEVINMEDEYLFGRSLLVAPVLEENVTKRQVYLPAGEWYDFWTGERAEGVGRITVTCPPGRISVFSRDPMLLEQTLPR